MDPHDAEPRTTSLPGAELLRDAETGLLGRAAWDTLLAAESARCARYGRVTTVVFMEVAGPDEISAVWGEQVGARAVTRMATELGRQSRTSDLVGRLGPRQFGILLPETDEVAAVNYVERTRAACLDALRTAGSTDRVRFGWADANRRRTLLAAAEVARTRLASDETEGEEPA